MMFQRVKITHKVIAIIAAGVCMGAMLVGWSIFQGSKQTNTLENIYSNNVIPLDNLRGIQLEFREIEYRMAGVQADVVGAINSGKHLEEALNTIDTLWSESTEQIYSHNLSEDNLRELKNFQKGHDGFKAMAGKLLTVYSNNQPDEVSDLFDEWLDYKPLIFKSIDSLAGKMKEDVKDYYVESSQGTAKMRTIMLVISLVVGVAFIGVALIVVRSIKKPIDTVVHAAGEVAEGNLTISIDIDTHDEMGNMSDKLNSMLVNLRGAFRKIVGSVESITADTEGLSDLSDKLLDGARAQQTKGEQVAVASTEMSQIILDMAKNTSNASCVTKESLEKATEGQVVVSKTVESINKLANNVSEVSETIEGLSKHTSDIGEIVSIIQDIANQTNLLALNAAIEAARSGEHGRGFAVVADEVKKLAERTANATDQISEKINTIQSESIHSRENIEHGKTLADEAVANANLAGETLQEIVKSSDSVADMVQQISVATEEQSSAAEEVSSNMEHIRKVINEHFELSEDMKKELADLTSLAQNVMTQTMYFKTENNGQVKSSVGMAEKPAVVQEDTTG
jgi:methyl-accepting chemotaxis protein